MSPRGRMKVVGVPTVEDVQTHCQRVRSAGSPNAKARPALVSDYRVLAQALSVDPEDVATGLDLQRASATLLRAASHAEQAAAAHRQGRR